MDLFSSKLSNIFDNVVSPLHEASAYEALWNTEGATFKKISDKFREAESVKPSDLREKIIIFDDVLTMGSHFKAIKLLLQDAYPHKKVCGLFIARSIFAPVINEFEKLEKQ